MQEAESKDLSLALHKTIDFAIHIPLAEAVLGSQGTFIASRTVLICWRGVMLVSTETVLDSHRVCNRLAESLICLNRDLLLRVSQRGSGYADLLAHM